MPLCVTWNASGDCPTTASGRFAETERYYVYSKVSAWVAIDRYLGSRRASAGEPQRLGRLADLRSRMHREICNEGYDRGLGRFVEYYGGQELDASLLLLPLLGFLPVDDERIAGTIAAIERELIEDG